MKQQNRRPIQVPALGQFQFLDQTRIAFFQRVGVHAAAGRCEFAECADGCFRQRCDLHARHRHAVPGTAVVAQEETIQRGALQLLKGAPAALVIVAPVADRRGVGRRHHFEVFPAAFAMQVDVDEDAEQVADLVRKLFQQPRCVGEADHAALVVAPDDQHAAFGIGEAAHPSQVIVAPEFLPFGVLGFDIGAWWNWHQRSLGVDSRDDAEAQSRSDSFTCFPRVLRASACDQPRESP